MTEEKRNIQEREVNELIKKEKVIEAETNVFIVAGGEGE